MILDTRLRINVAVYQPGFGGVTLSATADFALLRNVSRAAAPPQ